MDFFDEAWRSAASEYGRVRAEKYGKVAKFVRLLGLLAALALILACVWAIGGPLG